MLARRQFLAGVVGATAALGFNPITRRWVSVAHASSPFEDLPHLDGVLLFDTASRAADAVDVGNIVHETPLAVLRPGSVDDIQKMIRFSRRLGIPVAARGQGHTTFGQAQVLNGLVIEMSSLSTIHSITSTEADVDAGVLWKTLLMQSVPMGFTPPALTGFTGLSIGGTLSVGGISSSYFQGAQVDRVQELEVVTGAGDLLTCSRHEHRELFDAVRGGLGQCAIITRAVVDLVPALPFVRIFQPTYTDNGVFFDDLKTLVRREELRDLFTLWQPNPSGGFIYGLNAVAYFDPSNPPDNAHLLRGLSIDPSTTPFVDVPYIPYVTNVDNGIAQLIAAGLWTDVIHPWFDAFLPADAVERYVGDVIPTLTPADVGAGGFLLLFPHKKLGPETAFLQLPEGETVYLFDILTANAAPGPDPAFTATMLARNRRLFDKARNVGGTRYPIGSINFDHEDWVRQYGGRFEEFRRLKDKFDPDRILTPGPGIFRE
jgi:cytokinin dehydrogenase